ncbi:hypothetical protein [Aneurinibacillus aneurinilyticus]|uniref:hypothetical protein n=1 Tax=Aneurinibacillus aneurinilyticus TaxID=1391 RepID=UPI0035268C7D
MHASACSLVFSRKEEIRSLCGAKSGLAKHLGFSVQETNRHPFGTRWGGYPLWNVLDNQHPCYSGFKLNKLEAEKCNRACQTMSLLPR